jgi:hypothetical protein
VAHSGPLGVTCDTCTTALCAADAYCCNTAWDIECVGIVSTYCSMTCLPDGGVGPP